MIRIGDSLAIILSAGRLEATLGQFPSLACLSLGDNGIGEEGAGRLAAVRWQCPSLARLEPSYNLGRS